MHDKSRSCSPFGVATKRFTKIGFHPELDKSGAMKKEITKIGPGSFDPRRPRCKYKQGVSWQHKLEVEQFSKFLGYRNASVLRERQIDKSLRGPGNTDINEELFRKKGSSQRQNAGFGSGRRIADEIRGQEAPPPGNNFLEWIEKVSETLDSSKKTFSRLPTFEYDGLADRFKSKLKAYHLPSNLYNLNDKKNVADITRKIVSKRGPYDCFTGPRDGTTIKNYFSPPLTTGPDYFFIKPTNLEYLTTHPTKRRCGVFLKAARFEKRPTVRHLLNDLSLCYRHPDYPGPAHYDLSSSSIKRASPSKYPFDSSNPRARPPIDWRISPGPGRYNPKAPRCMKVKRPSWVFLAKVDRSLFKVPNYSLYQQ